MSLETKTWRTGLTWLIFRAAADIIATTYKGLIAILRDALQIMQMTVTLAITALIAAALSAAAYHIATRMNLWPF